MLRSRAAAARCGGRVVRFAHASSRRVTSVCRCEGAGAAPGARGHRLPVVAIDGPAACGKGTLAKKIAEVFRLAHLDTGLLYRAAGFKAVQSGVPLDDERRLVQLCESLTPDDLNDPGLRGDNAAAAASRVSVLPGVRSALSEYPRAFAASPAEGYNGAVLDGRDVGTVLCPNADIKLFLTASAEVRAERRLKELVSRGMVPEGDEAAQQAAYDKVLSDLQERDRRDMERATAPLKAADDAVIVDSSDMSREQVLAEAVALVERACPSLSRCAASV